MKKIITILLLIFIPLCFFSFAAEIVRQKGVETKIYFPMVNSGGNNVSAADGLDSEYSYWDDDTAPSSFVDCTNEATEVNDTGWYYLTLSNDEMNNDYIGIKTYSNTAGVLLQQLLIRTIVGDVLNIATTDDGGVINVSSGVVEADIIKISGGNSAADNLELDYDGTGYSKVNSTIGELTTLANDATAIKAQTDLIMFNAANYIYSDPWIADTTLYTAENTMGNVLNDIIAKTDLIRFTAANEIYSNNLSADRTEFTAGNSVGEALKNIFDNTDGQETDGEYQNLEKMIRRNR
jgi:hypothetical protein